MKYAPEPTHGRPGELHRGENMEGIVKAGHFFTLSLSCRWKFPVDGNSCCRSSYRLQVCHVTGSIITAGSFYLLIVTKPAIEIKKHIQI
jgi:hypothetical protein